MAEQKEPQKLSPALRPALEIFLRELDSHVLFFERTVQQIAELQSQNSAGNGYLKELRNLSGRFHTIKGGAGFFQLTEIKDFASTLEKLFQNQSAFSSEDSIKEELQNAIQSFSEQLATIRTNLSE